MTYNGIISSSDHNPLVRYRDPLEISRLSQEKCPVQLAEPDLVEELLAEDHSECRMPFTWRRFAVARGRDVPSHQDLISIGLLPEVLLEASVEVAYLKGLDLTGRGDHALIGIVELLACVTDLPE